VDKLGTENATLPPWRSKDDIPLPPYIDYQFAAILMEKVLRQLGRAALKSLEVLVLANRPSNWYSTFLAMFVLMHNYEFLMAFEEGYTRRRNYTVRF
jgi:hypothetical protein